MKRALPLFLAAAFPWLLASPLRASSSTAETLRIAQAYGLGAWDDVEILRYSFHVTKAGTTTDRRWEWNVKTDEVTLETTENGTSVRTTYSRQAMDQGDAALNAKVDRSFINDQYWLLFPLHIVWDNDAEITLSGEAPLPIGRGRAAKMNVTYPAQGGYTPGDMYEIFYGPVKGQDERLKKPSESGRWSDSPYIFRQWVFHKGGAGKPTLTAKWEGYKRLGPLVISTEHHDGSGAFHLWFDELSIKLKNDAEWKQPGPVDVLPSK